MSNLATPEAAPLLGAGRASARLVYEGSETGAETRKFVKKAFEPGTYMADGSFVFVRHPSPPELAITYQMMLDEIGSDVASFEVVRSVCAHNPFAWWAIFRSADAARADAKIAGFCGYLPLNRLGLA